MRKNMILSLLGVMVFVPTVSRGQEGAGIAPRGLGADVDFEQMILVEPEGTMPLDSDLWRRVDPEPTFGLASESVMVVGDFAPPNSTVTYATSVSGATGIGIYATASTGDWWVPVQVPSGAAINRITVDACDTSSTGQLLFGMARGDAPAGSAANATLVGGTGTTETPGCDFFSVTPTATLDVANGSNMYWVFLNWSGDFSGAVSLHGVRVSYQLQVSPAPGIATFNDVTTTNAQFRFVEALVVSGITSGCGGGDYCPDDPVTRGQMAVFLAAALGLHTAP